MRRRFALVVGLSPLTLFASAAVLTACAGVTDLGKAPTPYAGTEGAAVRRKADAALAEKKFADAWNLEAQAGTDRARLEAIALASLEADEGPADDMFEQLRAKFGGLTPEARARVTALSNQQMGLGKWTRAVEIELVAADDAPAFAGAWAVYEKAPPSDALAVLADIRSAREDHPTAAAAAKPK